MPPPWLQRFHSKVVKKRQDQRHVVGPDEFCGNLQNAGPQANGGLQQNYSAQQSHRSQNVPNSGQPLNRRPVGNGSNNSQPVSPIQPYGPQDFGNRQMFARPVVELDATRGTWAAERDEYLSREDFQRQYNQNQNSDVLQQAKEKSRLVAQRLERVEAEKARLERHRNASKESVRHLRELIRERYRLDLDIWREQDALEADRELTMVDCRRADEILKKMYSIVKMWDEELFAAEEWKVAKRIKDGLLKPDQHVVWTETPPWEFGGDGLPLREESQY